MCLLVLGFNDFFCLWILFFMKNNSPRQFPYKETGYLWTLNVNAGNVYHFKASNCWKLNCEPDEYYFDPTKNMLQYLKDPLKYHNHCLYLDISINYFIIIWTYLAFFRVMGPYYLFLKHSQWEEFLLDFQVWVVKFQTMCCWIEIGSYR